MNAPTTRPVLATIGISIIKGIEQLQTSPREIWISIYNTAPLTMNKKIEINPNTRETFLGFIVICREK
ncbi:MAG: hypothetical protein DRN88_05175 [Candidatus Hydrothermarchaeota archaeon]|nr:MAG: hypothetical protein DRN88_05175 [Candidatus Hydrothermarchaeota archaeon]